VTDIVPVQVGPTLHTSGGAPRDAVEVMQQI
jgi:hypothetical protein